MAKLVDVVLPSGHMIGSPCAPALLV